MIYIIYRVNITLVYIYFIEILPDSLLTISIWMKSTYIARHAFDVAGYILLNRKDKIYQAVLLLLACSRFFIYRIISLIKLMIVGLQSYS